MKDKIEAGHISGYVYLKSNLQIEELGEIISNQLFSGLEFSGKDLEIYEEVPVIFIRDGLMGLSVILQGDAGFSDD